MEDQPMNKATVILALECACDVGQLEALNVVIPENMKGQKSILPSLKGFLKEHNKQLFEFSDYGALRSYVRQLDISDSYREILQGVIQRWKREELRSV